jgi:hypothetical protein
MKFENEVLLVPPFQKSKSTKYEFKSGFLLKPQMTVEEEEEEFSLQMQNSVREMDNSITELKYNLSKQKSLESPCHDGKFKRRR